MLPADEVKLLSTLSLEALVYELLELVEKYFVPSSKNAYKYAQSKYVILDDLLRKKLVEIPEDDQDSIHY